MYPVRNKQGFPSNVELSINGTTKDQLQTWSCGGSGGATFYDLLMSFPVSHYSLL